MEFLVEIRHSFAFLYIMSVYHSIIFTSDFTTCDNNGNKLFDDDFIKEKKKKKDDHLLNQMLLVR